MDFYVVPTNYHKIMKSTIKNIKPSLFIGLLLSCLCVISSSAQTVYNMRSSQVALCGKDEAVVDGYYMANYTQISGGTPAVFSNGMTRRIALYEVDTDGTETLIDEIYHYAASGTPNFTSNANDDGVSPGGFFGPSESYPVSYTFNATAARYGKSNFTTTVVLRYLTVHSTVELMEAYYGKTLKLQIDKYPRNNSVTATVTAQYNYYFDVVGVEGGLLFSADNSVGAHYDLESNIYFAPCIGDGPITMEILNDSNPFIDDNGDPRVSYLGNSYTARYEWTRAADSWGRPTSTIVASDTRSYTDDLSSFTTSGYVTYNIAMHLYSGTEEVSCPFPVVESYSIYLFEPLVANNTFLNATSGATQSGSDKFVVCYGDDVSYTPSFVQSFYNTSTKAVEDVDLSSDVYWSLYEVDPITGDVIGSPLLEDEDIVVVSDYTFTNMTATTTYKMVAEYVDYDPNSGGHNQGYLHIYEGEENKCPTEVTFTIEVREVTASASITTPSTPVCEESSPEISASITSIPATSVAADYAYKWDVSTDGGSTYVPYSADVWLSSDDATWVDPTTSVSIVDTNIVYPSAAAGYKYYRFNYANSYVIDDTRYYCPMQETSSLLVHQLPILTPATYTVCKGQPINFDVVFSSNIEIPSGLTYHLYTACSAEGVCSGETTLDGVTVNSDSQFATYSISAATATTTYYAVAVDNATGCVSKPVAITIYVLPLPELSNLSVSKTDYCRESDDIVNLNLSVDLSSEYSAFDYASAGLSTPVVTYHWSWVHSGAPTLGSTSEVLTTDKPSLSAFEITGENLSRFKKLSSVNGVVTFSVWASDDQNCGYILDEFGAIISADGIAVVKQTVPVNIIDHPRFTMSEEKVCSNTESLNVTLTSLDSRQLTFDVTPVGSAPAPVASSVVVAGNSSNTLQINFTEVDAETVYTYNVTVTDNTVEACTKDTTLSITLYPIPHLIDADYSVCEGQPLDFGVLFEGNIPIPSGLTYNLYTNIGLTSLYTTGKSVADDYSSVTYSIPSASGSKYAFYAQAIDNVHNCATNPAAVINVYVKPLPNVDALTPSVSAYCQKDDDIKSLVLTADINTAYTSFYADADNLTNVGLSVKPKLTYHWSWTHSLNSSLNSTGVITTTDKNTLSASDLSGANLTNFKNLSKSIGVVTFSVWVSDSENCGYVLNADGSIATGNNSALVSATSPVEITNLPKFTMSEEKACSNTTSLDVTFTVLDSRNLTFDISPVGSAPVPASSSVVVSGNSSGSVTIPFSEVAENTTFSYNVTVTDNTSEACSTDTVLYITLYEPPYVSDAEYIVCQDEPFSFLTKYDTSRNYTPQSGLTYRLYTSYVGDVLSGEVNLDGKFADTDEAHYLINSVSSSRTCYLQATDNKYGCVSNVATITIRVAPAPNIKSLTTDRVAYCQFDSDIESIQLTAELQDSYSSFDFSTLGVSQPKLTYHWEWQNADVSYSDDTKTSTVTTTTATTYSGNLPIELADVIGNVTFRVWATDEMGCGYDYNVSADYDIVNSNAPHDKIVNSDVKIQPHPYINVSDEQVCAVDGVVEIAMSSNDSRNINVDITPIGSAPAPDATTLSVVAGGTTNMVVHFSESDLSDVTDFQYQLSLTDNTAIACQFDTVITFRAYPKPTVVFTPTNNWVCKGNAITIVAKPSVKDNGVTKSSVSDFTYSWKLDGASIATTSNTYEWQTEESTTDGLHTFSVDVSYTFSDGHVCAATYTYDVFVNVNPVFTLTADDATICEGDETILHFSVTNASVVNQEGVANNYTYTLSPAAKSESTIAEPTASDDMTFTVAPTATTDYTLRVLNNVSNCYSEEVQQIVVKKRGHIDITAVDPTQICAGNQTIEISFEVTNPTEFDGLDFSTLLIDGVAPDSYTFDSSVNTGVITLTANFTADGENSATKVFGTNVSIKTVDNCLVEIDQSQSLKVNPIPSAPDVTAPLAEGDGVDRAKDNAICFGEEVVTPLTYRINSPKTGFNYEVYIQPSMPTSSDEPYRILTRTSPVLNLTGAFTKKLTSSTFVWVRSVDVNSPTACPSEYVSFPILVHDLPAPTVAAVSTICEDTHTTLVVTDPTSADYYYVFTDKNGTQVTASDNTTPSYTTDDLTETSNYYLVVEEVSTGCKSETQTIVVPVHKKPTASTNVVCIDAANSTTITLPNGSTVTRQGFCFGDEGTATITITDVITDDGLGNITSNLVSVDGGNVSDWVKVDEYTWKCTLSNWAASQTLTFEITDDLCTSNTFTAEVQVLESMPQPLIAINTDAQEVCYEVDEALSITMTSYADMKSTIGFRLVSEEVGSGIYTEVGEVTRTAGVWVYNTSTNTLNIKKTTNFFIYAYDKASGCQSPLSEPVQVLVHELPEPTIASSDADNIVCPGDDVTLSVVETYEAYSWPDEAANNATTQSININPTQTTTYHYQVTDVYGCKNLIDNAHSVTITVKPRPQFILAASPAVVCQGTTTEVELIPTPLNGLGTSDNLTFVEPYAFSSTDGASVSAELQGDGTYKYYVRDHSWVDASVTFTATIYSSDADNACKSDDVLTTVEVISTLAQPDAQSVSAQDGVTKTKTVHACYGSTDPVTVSLENISAYPATGGVTYSYHWYSDAEATNELTSDGTYTVNATAGTITFVPTASMTIYAKVIRETEPNCESVVSEPVNIIIEALPLEPVALDPSDKYVCQPEEADEVINLIVESPAAESSYYWYRQNDGEVDTNMEDDILVATTSGSTPATIAAPTETIYLYARTVSQYNCFSAGKSNIVAVEVHENPVIKEVMAPPTDVCEGEAFTMEVGVVGSTSGITYKYVKTSPDNALLYETGTIDDFVGLLSVDASSVSVDNSETWVYEFTAVYGGSSGCESDATVVYSVRVHADPDFTPVVTPDPVCEQSDVTVRLNAMQSHDGSASLDVKLVDGNGVVLQDYTSVSNGSDFVYTISGVLRSQMPITYYVRDNAYVACEKVGQFAININAIPNFDITNSDDEVDQTPTALVHTYDYCVGQDMTLLLAEALPLKDSLGIDIVYAYQWYKDGIALPGEVYTSISRSSIASGVAGLYTLEVSSNGCTYTRSAQVNVHDLPEPTIIPGSTIDYYCMDDNFVVASGESYSKYRWEVYYNSSLIDANASTDSLFIYPLVDKSFITNVDLGLEVHLYVTDKYGCESNTIVSYIGSLSNPPIIAAVNGVETCGISNPFTITVSQDKANYSIELYNADGSELPAGSYTLEDSNRRIMTSDDFAEGNYLVRVTDTDTECTTDSVVRLTRYDIDINITADAGTIYYCENGSVDFTVNLSDNNGHTADFLAAVTSVNYTVSYLDNADNVVSTDPVVSLSDLTYSHTFTPADLGLGASVNPYKIKVNIQYVFNSDVENLTSCSFDNEMEVYIVPTPVLTADKSIPTCLNSDFVFTVDLANIVATNPTFEFFVNGVKVSGHDDSSNELSTAALSLSLAEGDVVTANVLMDNNATVCTSNQVVVTYFPDFKAQLNIDQSVIYCKNAPINYAITSVMPDGVNPLSHTLQNVANYTIYRVNTSGSDDFVLYDEQTPAISLSGSLFYEDDDDQVSYYAIVEDVNGCVDTTDVVTVDIKQFKVSDIVVSNANGSVLNLSDLCADVEYTYSAILLDGSNNVITPGSDYDFYFFVDDVEITDHAGGAVVTDNFIKYTHAESSSPVTFRVEVVDRINGCHIAIGSVEYPAYTEDFTYHTIPDPDVTLEEPLLAITDDPNDARTFEVCYDDEFTLDVKGDYITLLIDGVAVTEVVSTPAVSGQVDITTFDGTVYTEAVVGNPSTVRFTFNLEPSASFHDIQFLVNDGACQVLTDIWKFRKYEHILVSAPNAEGVDQVVDDVLTLCLGNQIDVLPATAEPNYTKGYNIYVNGSLVSSDDFSATKLAYSADSVGVFTITFKPDFGRNGCEKQITIDVKDAPVPVIALVAEDDTDISPVSYDADTHTYVFDRCENLSTNIKSSGAVDYILSVTKDGVDVTSQFISSYSGSEFAQAKTFYYDEASALAAGVDYNEYVFNYTYSIASCQDFAKAIVRVYQTPHAEFINDTPRLTVIEGAAVPVDVTPGFANYEFVINDSTVQNGASNTLAAADNIVMEDTEVKVIVSSIHGCDTTLIANIKVLEGIKPIVVNIDREYYCSDEPGAVITLEGMQTGVSYKIEGRPDLGSIVTGSADGWSPVRVADPTTLNPETFSVLAYYDILPDETCYMANTVTLEEVTSPLTLTMPDVLADDCTKLNDPSDPLTWTVSGAEYGMTYFIAHDSVVIESKPLQLTSPSQTELVINLYDVMNGGITKGQYNVVVRNKRIGGEYVCQTWLPGVLTVDIPTTLDFQVRMSPENGLFCSDDPDGVNVYIEGSDFSSRYDHYYVLYRTDANGTVEVDRKKSDASMGKISFNYLTLPTGITEASYTITCEFNGCVASMTGSADVKTISPAVKQIFTVDETHFCEDDPNGVTFTVASQQENYLYTLYLNGQPTSNVHVGDGSAAPFTFDNLTDGGTYNVVISYPELDRHESTCLVELDELTIVKEVLPSDPIATISNMVATADTICVGETTTIYLTNPQRQTIAEDGFEVHYELYEDGVKIADFSDDKSLTFLSFELPIRTVAASHVYDVIATKSATDGYADICTVSFDSIATLEVKDRPKTTEEILVGLVDPTVKTIDPCYGEDVIVYDPVPGNTYTLHRRTNYYTDGLGNVHWEVSLPVQTIVASSANIQASNDPLYTTMLYFADKRDHDAHYEVQVSNGYCYDVIDSCYINVDKLPKVQSLVVSGPMCLGDPGVESRLEDSEANVTYSLYFVRPADVNDPTTDLAEDMLRAHPGKKIQEFTTTYDHQYVIFRDLYQSEDSSYPYYSTDVVSGRLLDEDGYYYIVAVRADDADKCEVYSPYIDFQKHKLPLSYRLIADQKIYCGSADGFTDGVKVYLEASEVDVEATITYILYSVDAQGNLSQIESKVSSGTAPLYFETLLVEGTYVAMARKEYTADGHICTSMMEGEIVVEKRTAPKKGKADISVVADLCNEDNFTYQIPDEYLTADMAGAVFTLSGNSSQSLVFDGTNATQMTFTDFPTSGNYEVFVSYADNACETSAGNINVTYHEKIQTLATPIYSCDNSFSFDSNELHYLLNDGAVYDLVNDTTGAVADSKVYDASASHDLIFENIVAGSYSLNAHYVDANGNNICETTVVKFIRQTEIPSDVFADTKYACSGNKYDFDLSADHLADLVAGNIYYLTDDTTTPILESDNGKLFSGSNKVIFTGLAAGSYTIWASHENYSCLVPFGSLEVVDSEINDYTLSALRDCLTEQVTFSVDSSDAGAQYQLYAHLKTKESVAVESPIDGTGNPFSWAPITLDDNADYYYVAAQIGECQTVFNRVYVRAIDYDFEFTASNFYQDKADICSGDDPKLYLENSQVGVEYYLVRNDTVLDNSWMKVGDGNTLTWELGHQSGTAAYNLRAVHGNCSAEMWREIVVDFDAATLPTGSLALYIQGVKYTSADTNIPSVCPGSNVNITASVDGVNVRYYNFYRSVAGVRRDTVTSTSNAYIPFYADEDISGNITVEFSVETFGGCVFNIDDAITFHLGNDYAEEEHLVANHYEYCEGSPSVKLAFINTPTVGYTYRLYKQANATDTINPHDELVDIQEIPDYVTTAVDSLWFNGWGFDQSSQIFADAGFYYVRVRTPEGCDLRTNTVEIIENALPVDSTNEVFFAGVNDDGTVDLSSLNYDFGVLDGGYLVLSNPLPNVRYELVHTDIPGIILETKTIADISTDGYLTFGPIRSLETDREKYGIPDTLSNWGEGYYDIHAVDTLTNCDIDLGDVLFVDEELIAHDVEIYLNKNEMSRIVSLVPNLGYKYTKRYIEWSNKIDKVYYPQTEYNDEGRFVVDENSTADRDYSNYAGYVKTVEESNIRFELLPEENAINGTYGFVDVTMRYDDSNVLPHDEASTTGWFLYEKKPSFFGREQVKYQIYNSAFTDSRGNKLRVSNTATITILCGNEETGDTTSVFLIPNAFSPNGDGLNDVFKIIIPDKYQERSESKLEVFNRWGTLVYRSSGLQYGADENWWDGSSTTSNMATLGSKLPSGTYYYVFTITFIDSSRAVKSSREMHGYIELRR